MIEVQATVILHAHKHTDTHARIKTIYEQLNSLRLSIYTMAPTTPLRQIIHIDTGRTYYILTGLKTVLYYCSSRLNTFYTHLFFLFCFLPI